MTKIELNLQRLECHVQGDASGGSEPYLWPVLLWVSDRTLGSPALVGSNHPHAPRTVLGQDVRAGTTLAVPTAVGTVRTQLADGDLLRRAIAVVTLLENDETPQHVVDAAYDAYVTALPGSVAAHLADLASQDPAVVAAATDAVKAEVASAVKDAGSSEMTTWEKFKVGIGSLNLDDQVGASFDSTTTTRGLGLRFRETTGSGSSTRVAQDWLLTGSLVVDNRVDLCAAQVLAVNQATVRRNQARDQLLDLRSQFAQASPAEREALRLDIEDAQEALGSAEADLAAAQAALEGCRARWSRHRPPVASSGGTIEAAGPDQPAGYRATGGAAGRR